MPTLYINELLRQVLSRAQAYGHGAVRIRLREFIKGGGMRQVWRGARSCSWFYYRGSRLCVRTIFRWCAIVASALWDMPIDHSFICTIHILVRWCAIVASTLRWVCPLTIYIYMYTCYRAHTMHAYLYWQVDYSATIQWDMGFPNSEQPQTGTIPSGGRTPNPSMLGMACAISEYLLLMSIISITKSKL